MKDGGTTDGTLGVALVVVGICLTGAVATGHRMTHLFSSGTLREPRVQLATRSTP